MALMDINFYSETLGIETGCMLVLPESEAGIGVSGSSTNTQYPVLWLLHGASDDESIWLRRTSIERYALEQYAGKAGLAVVMPRANLSRYAKMANGQNYFSFFTEELPAFLRSIFPLCSKRENNFIAGLSMGGAGALKIGLSCPDNYSAIGCFSSGNLIFYEDWQAIDYQRPSHKHGLNETVYGIKDPRTLAGNINFDAFAMIEKAIGENKKIPRIFHTCGTEDFLLSNSRYTANKFAEYKKQHGIDYTYFEDKGSHTWEYWDKWVQYFLSWLCGQKVDHKAII